MANKRITTELVVKASDQYSTKLKTMSGVTGRFANKVRADMVALQKIRGPLGLIQDYKTLQSTFGKSEAALRRQREKVAELRREMRATENPTKKMSQDFDRAQRSAERLRLAHQKNGNALASLRGKLRSVGVNTGDLAGDQRRLESALNSSNRAFATQASRMERLQKMQGQLTAGRERMDRSLATAANVSFVGNASMQTGRRILSGVSKPIMQAVEFESSMADVRKVVDFESPEAFRQMSDDILKLSTQIPMSTSALAMLAATGGQLGIAREDLMDFSIQAAKIGIAFDISAEMAADSLGTMQTALSLSLTDSAKLFDAMNYISNNSAAKADQTLEFVNRAGSKGLQFGFKPEETLAFGSAMIAAGAGADTANTSFQNMGRALTKGESVTDRQSKAYRRLGLEAASVAKAMQNDAVGTTVDVLQRLGELPDYLQASVMSDLFGDEARELSKLLSNMELLPKMLGMDALARQLFLAMMRVVQSEER